MLWLCQMLISNKLYLPSSFTSMVCSSFSNVASSSLLHYNTHFSTRKEVHQVRHSYHEVKSSKSHEKLKEIWKSYALFLKFNICFFNTFQPWLCPKIQNFIHEFIPFNNAYFQHKITSQKHLNSWDNSPKIQGKSDKKNQR